MRLRIFGIVLCNWDVNSIGCHLTWTNGVVWSKLDRVMVNDRWIQEGREIYAHFLPEGCLSDHSPSITTIGVTTLPGEGASSSLICGHHMMSMGA